MTRIMVMTYDSYKCWTCAELFVAFTFFMENIYVQFDGMVYQQIVGMHCFIMTKYCFYNKTKLY